MAQLGFDSRYHLTQLSKLSGTDGQIANFGKVLTERLPLLRDMPIFASNAILSYTGVREDSLPTPQIINVGDGWDAGKAEWSPFTEVISMFKDRIDIPRDALRIQANPTGRRVLIRDRHMEGFGQGVSNHIFNGTSVGSPEKFDGLAVRYKTPDASDELNPTNGDYGVYDMGGVGSDTASIWFIQWAEDKVSGIHPLNDPHMGLRTQDMGLQYVTAENSKQSLMWRTELEWDLGIKVDDVRGVARLRNIKKGISNIDTNLWRKIVEIKNNFRGQETVWMYVGQQIFTHLDIMTADKNNVQLSSANPYNEPLLMFRDSPIRLDDSLNTDEAAVAAA